MKLCLKVFSATIWRMILSLGWAVTCQKHQIPLDDFWFVGCDYGISCSKMDTPEEECSTDKSDSVLIFLELERESCWSAPKICKQSKEFRTWSFIMNCLYMQSIIFIQITLSGISSLLRLLEWFQYCCLLKHHEDIGWWQFLIVIYP